MFIFALRNVFYCAQHHGNFSLNKQSECLLPSPVFSPLQGSIQINQQKLIPIYNHLIVEYSKQKVNFRF